MEINTYASLRCPPDTSRIFDVVNSTNLGKRDEDEKNVERKDLLRFHQTENTNGITEQSPWRVYVCVQLKITTGHSRA